MACSGLTSCHAMVRLQLCQGCWIHTRLFELKVQSGAQGAEARLAAGDMQKIFALCCVTSFEEVSSCAQDPVTSHSAASIRTGLLVWAQMAMWQSSSVRGDDAGRWLAP